MYGLCLVEKAVPHVRPFKGLWKTVIYLSSSSSSSSFIHTIQVHGQRKNEIQLYKLETIENKIVEIIAKVARAFFNLGSFSSMYNQRDNVLFCLGGRGGVHSSIPRGKAYSSSPAPFYLCPLPGLEVLRKVTQEIDVLSPGKGTLHPLCLSRWDFLTTLHWNSCRLIR